MLLLFTQQGQGRTVSSDFERKRGISAVPRHSKYSHARPVSLHKHLHNYIMIFLCVYFYLLLTILLPQLVISFRSDLDRFSRKIVDYLDANVTE